MTHFDIKEFKIMSEGNLLRLISHISPASAYLSHSRRSLKTPSPSLTYPQTVPRGLKALRGCPGPDASPGHRPAPRSLPSAWYQPLPGTQRRGLLHLEPHPGRLLVYTWGAPRSSYMDTHVRLGIWNNYIYEKESKVFRLWRLMKSHVMDGLRNMASSLKGREHACQRLVTEQNMLLYG